MRKFFIVIIMFVYTLTGYANPTTGRIPQFSNEKVSVWETTIYPGKNQVLKMHRHEHDRVLIAFNSGILKITNNKGQVHYLKLTKDNSYYLPKNVVGEKHIDENVSNHPIKVLVVELNS